LGVGYTYGNHQNGQNFSQHAYLTLYAVDNAKIGYFLDKFSFLFKNPRSVLLLTTGITKFIELVFVYFSAKVVPHTQATNSSKNAYLTGTKPSNWSMSLKRGRISRPNCLFQIQFYFN
jgi:hypothetical protein